MGRVVSLHIYPMKSAAAVDLTVAELTPRGFAGDRRWMLIDETGEMLSSRRSPTLLRVTAKLEEDGLLLNAPDREPLNVEVPNTEPTRAEIWGQWTTGRDAGDAAAEWFSSYLGRPCRLLYQSDADIRPVKPRPNTVESDHVSFADGYPVLLIGTASLAELNRWIGRTPPILMDRFRPNIVVETSRPFEEDDWQSFRLGDAAFVNAKPCPRCVLTTFDPQSAQRDPDGEPLKALAKRRRDPNGDVVWFGTNVMPRSAGPIRVGDEFSTS